MDVLLPRDWEPNLAKKLNALFNESIEVTPDKVETEVACEHARALQILLLLYHWSLADFYLQVYHVTHQDTPILTRLALDGFPTVPFTCEGCGKEITDKDDLGYTFLFKTNSKITFAMEE